MNKTLARASLGAAAMLLVTSSTVGAWCRQPPPRFADPTAAITMCGDPRAFIELDNTDASRLPTTFRVVYFKGSDGQRVVKRITVRAGDDRLIKRWVKGNGRKVSVYDDATNELLARVKVTTKSVGRWSDVECRDIVARYRA